MQTLMPPAEDKSLSDFSINDPIHGTITLSPTEKKVIDHPYFQRLRRVKALGFLDRVFPSARHSRFEHSIGACHVAGLMFDAIRKNSDSIAKSQWSDQSQFKGLDESNLTALFTEEYKAALKLAALLHDVGHGPFSHASECIMGQLDDLKTENPDSSPEVLACLKDKREANHEDYSFLIADRILREIGLDSHTRKLVLSLKDSRLKLDDAHKDWRRILGSLVDGEFDSDRMDYLRRDSLFCGVPYGNFDFNRLMDGLAVVGDLKGGYSFAIKRGSISALEGFLFWLFRRICGCVILRLRGIKGF